MFRQRQVFFDPVEIEKIHLSPYAAAEAVGGSAVRLRREDDDRSVVIEGASLAGVLELLSHFSEGGDEQELCADLRRRGAEQPDQWLTACRMARILE